MDSEKSRILILGATGYVGNYIVKASVAMGHQTYIYTRPIQPSNTDDSSKLQELKTFESMGVTVFQGELDDEKKLVSVLKQVEVVISALPVPVHLDQLKIIKAMKEAGTIKRFLPSEYGHEIDRVKTLPAFDEVLDIKRKIRRATEASGIPYTFVVASALSAYFVDYLLHPRDSLDEVVVYGTGETKTVMNYEEDIAFYTVKAATDPRVANRIIICKPPKNIISQLDLISAWERKTGRTFKRAFLPEEELIKLSQTLPKPDNVPVAVVHSLFVKGDSTNYELTKDDLEASALYPNYNYTSIDAYLEKCLVHPPNPKVASF
ncbi:isoeugenol synthase 1-like [Carica papaya]|uniref:isoeugenol synthase 1-like n=1 Tax=Carica papaya TaxID=3649 RepID=UPI000B8C7DB0|nr:isoeugenol synthase 1-like [Carica papaya]